VKPRLLLAGAIALVVAVAAIVIVVLTNEDDDAMGQCPVAIGIFFKTDDAMRQAATTIEGDAKIAKVTALTKQEGYEKAMRSFADRPEIRQHLKPEFTPATLEVMVRDTADKQPMIEDLRNRLPGQLVQDLCEANTNPSAAALPPAPTGISAPGGGKDCAAGRIVAYFKTDDQMREAGDKLQNDPRVTNLARETKAEAYARYKQIFADQPELVNLARPEALPASVQVTPATGVTKDQLMAELRKQFPAADQIDDLCKFSDRMTVPPTR
jgi:cell division protein FtsX